MNRIVIPSVIAKTQKELDCVFSKVRDIARLFQLDVMDGRFVPSQSLNFDFRLPGKKYEYEAQLMVENPEEWIEKNGEKVDTIIAQIESVKNPESFIGYVKNKKKRVAFALKPETDVVQVQDYLESIDQVLVMTVHPGYYGGKFLPPTLDKVKRLRELKPELDIEVDGGIQPHTIERAREAGANLFVCGSYLIAAENNEERMKRINILKNIIQED
jgi:ribulose-phosphate 3-epimerase